MEKILSSFPAVQFAFAYGSGVIEQTSSSPSSPAPSSLDTLIDLVFVVDDPLDWHTRNMALNPSHYTPIIPFSPPWVAFIQSKVGARVWYNVYIPVPSIPSRLMKYGVISTSDLMRDLLSWKWLYIAGRLQKPVQILRSNLEIESAVQRNVEQALRVALLLMPRLFNEVDLFRGVASLSYIGDPRMLVGENPKKIVNLVSEKALPLYRKLYSPAMESLRSEGAIKTICATTSLYAKSESAESRWKLCAALPLPVRRLLLMKGRAHFHQSRPPGNTALRGALASIVAKAAGPQSVKGVVTAGILKCSHYILSKVSKRFSFKSMSTYSSAAVAGTSGRMARP